MSLKCWRVLWHINVSKFMRWAERAVGVWGPGAMALQVSTDKLTLSHPGKQIMPITLLLAPPLHFQTFLRHWLSTVLSWIEICLLQFMFQRIPPPPFDITYTRLMIVLCDFPNEKLKGQTRQDNFCCTDCSLATWNTMK